MTKFTPTAPYAVPTPSAGNLQVLDTECQRPNIEPRSVLPAIEGLRGLLAFYVVLHHCAQITTTAEAVRYWPMPFSLFQFGHEAVALFIVVSGFCLALPIVDSMNAGTNWMGAAKFFKRRARRILPPYYASLALSAVLVIVCDPSIGSSALFQMSDMTATGVLQHVFLLQNWSDRPYEINSVLWTVALECQIYLFVPIMAWAWRRFGYLSIATAIVGAYALAENAHLPGYAQPDFFVLFVLGMACCAIVRRRSPLCEMLRRVPWTLALVAGCVITYRFYEFDTVALAPAILPLFVLIGTGKITLLSSSPATFLGRFAYSTYLLHVPLLMLIYSYLIHPFLINDLARLGALLATVPLVLVFTYGFYAQVERPFMTSRPKTSKP